MKFKWLLACLPLALGLSIALLLGVHLLPNPILYLRIDIGTLFWLLGAGTTALALLWLVFWVWGRHWVMRQAQAWAAEDRRRFLRRLDHELKNPLTAIRAGLANLSDPYNPPEARPVALTSVSAQIMRISRLTADLRKLAELETRPLEFSQVNLNDLLQQAISLAQEKPDTHQRRLNLSLPRAPWPLPNIRGDRDLLFLALHNLLDNALKFTRPDDTVEVRAFEDNARVVIEIADTGPGIPPEDLPHVWEELFRGRGARGVPGSGLGLALVRAIIDRHNGQITLRSRPNQGTVFTLRLPIG